MEPPQNPFFSALRKMNENHVRLAMEMYDTLCIDGLPSDFIFSYKEERLPITISMGGREVENNAYSIQISVTCGVTGKRYLVTNNATIPTLQSSLQGYRRAYDIFCSFVLSHVEALPFSSFDAVSIKHLNHNFDVESIEKANFWIQQSTTDFWMKTRTYQKHVAPYLKFFVDTSSPRLSL